MGDLAHYSVIGKTVSGRDAAEPKVGLNVNHGDWSGKIVLFQELGATVSTEGEVVAEAVEDDMLVRRKRKNGQYFMRRIGWQARLSGIIVVVSERDVLPQPDGKFKPQGEWHITSTSERGCVGSVKSRTGDVVDDSVNPAFTSAKGSASESHDLTLEDTAFALSCYYLNYLPRAVREGLARAMPGPSYFHCEAVRYPAGSQEGRHKVSVLRMSGSDALVLLASRQAGASSWQVRQLQYHLDSPVKAIEALSSPILK